jgi:hypothetical protein
METSEDVHFLIDNVPPQELELTLRCLDSLLPKSTDNLRSELNSNWNFLVQKNYTFTTRRLQDLGLATKSDQDRNSFILTNLGYKVQQLLDTLPELCPDIFHYLHYSGSPEVRKYFLSYKWCCQTVWARKEILSTSELVGEVQSRIEANYPALYGLKVGGNFNAGGVSAWRAWISKLEPSVLSDDPKDKQIYPRDVSAFQLALLSLNNLYQDRGYCFGDPVLLDDELVDELAGIFFLDHNSYRSLVALAAKVTRHLTIRDSFAGTTITLIKPFTVEDI